MLTLTDDEIEEITNRRQRPAQSRVLKALGIRHQTRPDGSLLVYRSAMPKAADTIQPREPQLRLRNGPSAQVR
ncbi:hypothetical protein BER2_1671 [plant metagenome]|uniref:DUF4224 domain-containing protein n=1 Tax=plant metagenome TaxID=1297885 RepID=A0A484Q2E6_9ZZZZ